MAIDLPTAAAALTFAAPTPAASLDRLRRALASGAALRAVLGPDETALRQQAEEMDRSDPRLEWLLTQAKRWRRANEKTLVFVAHRETLEMLRDALSARAQLASGVFHEELSAARRDTEVARFRAEDGPSILVSTEAGGEGRNFEFCHRLVLYDLPWKPSTVEQRIGRLDRIGRRIPVEIVYFRPPSGIGADVVRLFERLGIFREPWPESSRSSRRSRARSKSSPSIQTACPLRSSIRSSRPRRRRARESTRPRINSCIAILTHSELGPAILGRVPKGLDALVEQVVVSAASRLGFRVEQVRGRRAYAIDFGSEALIDSLPGVPGGSSFVGSFDREYAVEDEGIDFFASGHPLVEGLLAHFDENPNGRVARLEVSVPGQPGRGLIAIYREGPEAEIVAFDADGLPRPDWAAAFSRRPLAAEKMKTEDVARHDWPALVARLAPRFGSRRPHALAAVVVRSK